MPTTITEYAHLSELLANALIDLDGVPIYVALVDSTYLFDQAHTQWADASAAEITGTGYTAGGAQILNAALTRVGTVTTLDGDDVTWAALTATFRRGVAYAQGTFGTLTNPLMFSILFDDTPADVSVSGIDFRIVWHADGIIRVGSGA